MFRPPAAERAGRPFPNRPRSNARRPAVPFSETQCQNAWRSKPFAEPALPAGCLSLVRRCVLCCRPCSVCFSSDRLNCRGVFSRRAVHSALRRPVCGAAGAMRAASLLRRPPRAARLTSRAVRFLTDHPAGNGRIYTGPPRCWRKGRKKGLPLSRQSFLYGGDWQNSAVGSPMQSAYFAAALFFCLLMVEIPSMASTMARMTSSTPRIA